MHIGYFLEIQQILFGLCRPFQLVCDLMDKFDEEIDTEVSGFLLDLDCNSSRPKSTRSEDRQNPENFSEYLSCARSIHPEYVLLLAV